MFNLDHILRVATAAVGALVLSTVTIGATVGPEMLPQKPVLASLQGDRAYG